MTEFLIRIIIKIMKEVTQTDIDIFNGQIGLYQTQIDIYKARVKDLREEIGQLIDENAELTQKSNGKKRLRVCGQK